MKKLLISLLLIAPLLAGCTNIDTKITLNKDNSVSVISSLTYEGNLADKSDIDAKIINDNYFKFIDDSYKIDKAYGEKLSTIAASKNVDNIFDTDVDLTPFGFTSNLPSGKFIDVKKNFLATSYNINMVYDFPKVQENVVSSTKLEEENANEAMVPEYLQKYGDPKDLIIEDQGRADFVANLDQDSIIPDKQESSKDDMPINPSNNNKSSVADKNDNVEVSFSVELPYFAYYNNADSTDGNIYTWNIRKDIPTIIRLQYVQYSAFAVWFIILLGIGLLIYFARRITKHENQKRIGSGN